MPPASPPGRCSEQSSRAARSPSGYRRSPSPRSSRRTPNASDSSLRHSLRAGFLTAAKRGASIFKMMDVSRHRSIDTLRGYVRDAELFQDHAGAGRSWKQVDYGR
jgi:hypothetical protein